MRLVAIVSLFLAFAFATGCVDPCDKALKKMKKCWEMTQKKPENPADGPIFAEVCKVEKAKFQKCLSITDCAEYAKCISEASNDPRAAELLKQAGEAAAEPAAAPADMPAEAPAADMPAEAPMEPAAAPADMPAEAPAADMK
jgi:hypothetical protein